MVSGDCKIGLDPIEMGKTFGLIHEIAKDVREIKADVKNQNGRIRKLEVWRAGIVAGVLTITTIVGIIIKFFT